YAQKAMADYDAAIRLNNSHVLYYYRRASVKYFLKRYADAITDYNKVITMHAPEAGTQYNYAMYYRGRCYYYLNNLASACKDFKRSGELGIAAGKKDFASYCAVPAGPDCNRTFYSLREAISAGAGVVCKLDLSKENISTLPKELYSFVNLSELNLGATAIAPSAIAELQKALPKCTINYSAAAVTETDLGDIELDNTGYTNAAGQQVMQNVSRLLKAQPRGRIRLSAYYTTDEESKTITGYVNTIVNMFEKIGVNAKTQISRQIIKRPAQVQQQQQQQKAPDRPNFVIHVTGINLQDKQLKTSY
ncbi:MAG TPA: hypothetical protein VL307_20290, partial [Chitinophagaceae bacterium]|nr:hypothetical protein [Chitinophagaceae bacterium]